MPTAVGSGEEQPFPIQRIVKNSLEGDFCDYQWRHPHQVRVDVPSGETDIQPEGRCRKGLWCHQSLTICLISCPSWGCSCCRESQHSVPMIMPSSIMYNYPPWFLRWWQRAVAWFQIYWYDLLWTSEGVNRGLCMSSLKSLDWVCPSPRPFFLFVIFKWQRCE